MSLFMFIAWVFDNEHEGEGGGGGGSILQESVRARLTIIRANAVDVVAAVRDYFGPIDHLRRAAARLGVLGGRMGSE